VHEILPSLLTQLRANVSNALNTTPESALYVHIHQESKIQEIGLLAQTSQHYEDQSATFDNALSKLDAPKHDARNHQQNRLG
jgi:hypothetical protein